MSEILKNIKWDDEGLNFDNPEIVASKYKNEIKVYLNEDNYILSKIYLSRNQRKDYDKIGLENFEINKETKDIIFKEDVNLEKLLSTDKISTLESMLYKEIVVEGAKVKFDSKKLKDEDILMPLRQKLVQILMELNELGL
ncbi:MAG: hypothetical protein ACRC92_21725 [Peptostreptococcaceae bacterium]